MRRSKKKDKKRRREIDASVKPLVRITKYNLAIAKKKRFSKGLSYEMSRNSSSTLLKFLASSKFNNKPINYKYIRFKKNSAIVKIPKIFSFSENTDETILLIQEFFQLRKGVKEIYFDHSNCEELGICASTVMDVILMNIKKDKNIKGINIDLGGITPDEMSKPYEILFVSGLLKHLGITTENPDPEHIRRFDLISGGENIGQSKNFFDKSGVVGTKITRYYNECVQTQGFSLSRSGQNLLGRILGEVILNCEHHGGDDFCEWHVLSHYSMDKTGDYGELLLAIFNFGQTIYDGLKYGSKSAKTKMELEKMSDEHKGFFGVGSWDEECLWTLYALQEGVSRLRDEDKGKDRGTGTIRLIGNFQKIGYTYEEIKKPVMSIVSGNTKILFDDKYSLSKKMFHNEERSVIAFNKENDLRLPPDGNNVKRLKYYFPGTVISLKFYLDRKYLLEGKVDEYEDQSG